MRLVMEASGLALWPSVSLVVFFAACLAMLAWIYRPGSRVLYREMSGMALDEVPESGSGFISRTRTIQGMDAEESRNSKTPEN